MDKQNIYKIPCVWQSHGYFEIEATSLGDAIALAYERGELPHQGEYIEDSFEVDFDGIEIVYPAEARSQKLKN